MNTQTPLIGVVMGSDSDWKIMQETARALKQLAVPHEVSVISAHRTPDAAAEYARTASERGLRVLIAGAGCAAHLAGALAAQTTLPIIGVPLEGPSLGGLDALLATVQMPGGIPVATVAIGKAGAKNAALLAAQILALSDPALAGKLNAMRKEMTVAVQQKSRAVAKLAAELE